MKTLLMLFSLALLACIGANAQEDPGCLNNCWMNTPSCTQCHYTGGEVKTICSGCPLDCWGCSVVYLSTPPLTQPAQSKVRHETLIGYIRGLAGLPRDPVAYAGYGIDPRTHLKLMQMATSQTDAKQLGKCSKAFNPATIQLLPAEISRVRENLRIGSGVLATFKEPAAVPRRQSLGHARTF